MLRIELTFENEQGKINESKNNSYASLFDGLDNCRKANAKAKAKLSKKKEKKNSQKSLSFKTFVHKGKQTVKPYERKDWKTVDEYYGYCVDIQKEYCIYECSIELVDKYGQPIYMKSDSRTPERDVVLASIEDNEGNTIYTEICGGAKEAVEKIEKFMEKFEPWK